MKMLNIILIEYFFLAILNYKLLFKLDLKFENRKNENVELKEKDKKIFFMIISVLWIIYLPKIILNTIKERNKK